MCAVLVSDDFVAEGNFPSNRMFFSELLPLCCAIAMLVKSVVHAAGDDNNPKNLFQCKHILMRQGSISYWKCIYQEVKS